MGNLKDVLGMLKDSLKNQNPTLFHERLGRLQRERRLLRGRLPNGGVEAYTEAAGFWAMVTDASTNGNFGPNMRVRLTAWPYRNLIDNTFQQGLMVDLVMHREHGLVTEWLVHRPEWVRGNYGENYGRTFLVSRFVWDRHRGDFVPA